MTNSRRATRAFVAVAVFMASVVFADAPALVRKEQITPGVWYREYASNAEPLAIQVLEVERAAPGIAVEVWLARGMVAGLETLPDAVTRLSADGRDVIGAVNGDFFVREDGALPGDLAGLCVVDGELVSTPNRRAVLAFDGYGSPSIERFAFTGTATTADGASMPIVGVNQPCPDDGLVLVTDRMGEAVGEKHWASMLVLPSDVRIGLGLSVETFASGGAFIDCPTPALPGTVALVGKGTGERFLRAIGAGAAVRVAWSVSPSNDWAYAVGGGPRLLRNGAITVEQEAEAEGLSAVFLETLHPRTAVGFDPDRLYFVTVDGRQPGYSIGIGLRDLAAFLRDIGASEAINLDGGGSTTMWAGGDMRNRPSDGSTRSIANGLVIHRIRESAQPD